MHNASTPEQESLFLQRNSIGIPNCFLKMIKSPLSILISSRHQHPGFEESSNLGVTDSLSGKALRQPPLILTNSLTTRTVLITRRLFIAATSLAATMLMFSLVISRSVMPQWHACTGFCCDLRGNGTASTDLKHDQRRQHGQSIGFPEPRAFLWCITRAVSHTLSMLAMRCAAAAAAARRRALPTLLHI